MYHARTDECRFAEHPWKQDRGLLSLIQMLILGTCIHVLCSGSAPKHTRSLSHAQPHTLQDTLGSTQYAAHARISAEMLML